MEAVAACFDSQRALYDESPTKLPVKELLRELDASSLALETAVEHLTTGRGHGVFGDADYAICRVRMRVEKYCKAHNKRI